MAATRLQKNLKIDLLIFKCDIIEFYYEGAESKFPIKYLLDNFLWLEWDWKMIENNKIIDIIGTYCWK